MKMVPFGEEEFEEYLERFDEQIRYDFDLFFRLKNPDPDDPPFRDGKELSEDEKKLLVEECEKSLGIEYYMDAIIINLIGFIFCGEGAFIYKGKDSRGIEIRDVNGEEGYLLHGKFFDPVADAIKKELR